MNSAVYKYNVGDTIKFKDKFSSSASCGLAELVSKTAEIEERTWYAAPCYKLKGLKGWFRESCFAGLA